MGTADGGGPEGTVRRAVEVLAVVAVLEAGPALQRLIAVDGRAVLQPLAELILAARAPQDRVDERGVAPLAPAEQSVSHISPPWVGSVQEPRIPINACQGDQPING